MSGYCPDCGNTLCICDSETRATYPYRVKILELESKNKKLRDALEFYAESKKYHGYSSNKTGEYEYYQAKICDDNGRTAREALKEIKEN